MVEPVDPSRLLADSRAFLSELAANNSREWFQANKGRYDARLKRPAERLLADVGDWLAGQVGTAPRRKLFRPHRDLRFSEDKTPYHTHLHMMWSLPDGRAWMLGISTDYATAGAGVMQFDGRQLELWRQAVSGPEGANLAALVAQNGWRVDDPALKRVPAPYPADHPQEELLRRKGFVAWQDGLETELSTDPQTALTTRFQAFAPLMDLLGRCL